jgi:hypothetical protein
MIRTRPHPGPLPREREWLPLVELLALIREVVRGECVGEHQDLNGGSSISA